MKKLITIILVLSFIVSMSCKKEDFASNRTPNNISLASPPSDTTVFIQYTEASLYFWVNGAWDLDSTVTSPATVVDFIYPNTILRAVEFESHDPWMGGMAFTPTWENHTPYHHWTSLTYEAFAIEGDTAWAVFSNGNTRLIFR